jgi:hypothetical protein
VAAGASVISLAPSSTVPLTGSAACASSWLAGLRRRLVAVRLAAGLAVPSVPSALPASAGVPALAAASPLAGAFPPAGAAALAAAFPPAGAAASAGAGSATALLLAA